MLLWGLSGEGYVAFYTTSNPSSSVKYVKPKPYSAESWPKTPFIHSWWYYFGVYLQRVMSCFVPHLILSFWSKCISTNPYLSNATESSFVEFLLNHSHTLPPLLLLLNTMHRLELHSGSLKPLILSDEFQRVSHKTDTYSLNTYGYFNKLSTFFLWTVLAIKRHK